VVVMGHSAGAYNALMLALDRRWLAARGLSADALRRGRRFRPLRLLSLRYARRDHSFGRRRTRAIPSPWPTPAATRRRCWW
jgi:hypothetical protein